MGISDTGTFRSLRRYNFRVWSAGALVSNIGGWMQRIAQDWLVLTQLTPHDATAVGIVSALQFAPLVLLLPWTGPAADHFDKRKLVAATQAAMGVLALGLGLLTITHLVQVWHVYVFALLLGCVTAFDTPARQTFIGEMVGDDDLANAVGLNSMSFNASRLVGPAIAGGAIAVAGSGGVFLINAATFAFVLVCIGRMRPGELRGDDGRQRPRGTFVEGLRYVWSRRDLRAILLMLFLIGTFGLNFPIFVSTMAASVFHVGADGYGLLTSCIAVGSVIGALMVARRARPGVGPVVAGSAIFGAGCVLAAAMPTVTLFGAVLVVVGAAAQTVTTSATALVQMSIDPAMRGRVVAILFSTALGGTPIGAPLVGLVANDLGPRWALGLAAAAGLAAALVGVVHLAGSRVPPADHDVS